MNIHEYQAKEIFRKYGLPVGDFLVSTKATGIGKAAYELSPGPFVCKCQVHSGGRGKAGGVAKVDTPAEAEAFAAKWLGRRLVTAQSGPQGKPVNKVLIERATEVEREIYVSCTVDRSRAALTVLASACGGMSIEEVAKNSPEKIFREEIDLLTGPEVFQGRELAAKLGLTGKLVGQFVKIFTGIVKMFLENDLSLAEINPLAVTKDGRLQCLDAKINIDSYALYRHRDLAELDDPTQEDPRVATAVAAGFSYVPLEGTIGCLVNGAGLAMGTMDIIKNLGGTPANFLDVILEDPHVRCIMVNIFGGIVRCDMIAEGIKGAVAEINTKVPVVVRLEGNHAAEGQEILSDTGLNIVSARDLRQAAALAVRTAAQQD